MCSHRCLLHCLLCFAGPAQGPVAPVLAGKVHGGVATTTLPFTVSSSVQAPATQSNLHARAHMLLSTYQQPLFKPYRILHGLPHARMGMQPCAAEYYVLGPDMLTMHGQQSMSMLHVVSAPSLMHSWADCPCASYHSQRCCLITCICAHACLQRIQRKRPSSKRCVLPRRSCWLKEMRQALQC